MLRWEGKIVGKRGKSGDKMDERELASLLHGADSQRLRVEQELLMDSVIMAKVGKLLGI